MKGNYKDFDMTNLNLTIVRDYSLYMALKSAGQGVGEKVRIHSSSCSLSVRDYNLYMALKSAGQGVGKKVRIHASSCSFSVRFLHKPQVRWSGHW
jgi:hypothetical protein